MWTVSLKHCRPHTYVVPLSERLLSFTVHKEKTPGLKPRDPFVILSPYGFQPWVKLPGD
jgi:hypothetical protein